VSTPPSAAPASAAAPAFGKVRPAFVAQAGLIAAALTIYALVLAGAGLHHQDLDAYLAAGRAIWRGQPLYVPFLHHPFPDATLRPAFIYPPAFAIVMAPLGLLPDAAANIVWLLIGQGSLVAALLLTIRWLRPSTWAVTAMLCATVTFYPLWIDAVQGQANLPILLLVIAGIAGIVRGKPSFGVALGAAAALKLTPFILLAWLLLDRRIKEAAWMIGGFAAITAAAALLRAHDTLVFFGQVLPALSSGTAFYANQSIGGMVARVFSANPYTTPWIALSWAFLLPVAAAIVLIAVWFARTRHQPALARATVFIPLLPLLSSVTWPHHLVVLLPVIWIGASALAERDWPAAPTTGLAGLLVIFDVVARWAVGPAFGQPGFASAQTADPMVFVVANAFFLGTLLMFLYSPWLLRAR
jgi:alpha-1,2-mannosyltransferase